MEELKTDSHEEERKKLTEMCRNISLDRLKAHTNSQDIEIQETTSIEDKSDIGNWLSLVFVSSHAVKLNFKTFFHLEDANHLTAQALGVKDEEVEKKKVDDFIKEFCNLTAGGVKLHLENSGFSSLISLPLLTRGSDVFFFKAHPDIQNEPVVFSDAWDLVNEGKRLTCSIYFEIYDKDAFQKIILNAFGADAEDDGEVDFFDF